MAHDAASKRAALSRLASGTPGAVLTGEDDAEVTLDGALVAFVTAAGTLGVKLGRADREAWLRKHGGGAAHRGGQPVPGFVAVGDAVLDDDAALRELWAKATGG